MKISFFLIALFVFIGLKAQDLEKYQWKNRLVLIFVDQKSSELLKNQVDMFIKNTTGLKERKLKVFQFSENDFKTDFHSSWKPSTLKVENFFNRKEKFKVILIGLDGGIKYSQNTILSKEKLFTIIDGMPMRQRELQQNRN